MKENGELHVTTGDLIRRMVLAHVRGDSHGFEAAVRDLISEERKKNHVVYAKDIERILAASSGARLSAGENLSLLPLFTDVPRDKDRAADLVEVIEPQRTLDDLVLSDDTALEVMRIIRENRNAELLHSHGLNPAKRILFCGPPGCGKTLTAEAIASALYLPLVLVRFDAVISSYLGETAANLRRVFDWARGRPMVLLFDEFDAIGKRRDDHEEHGELKRVVNSFLQMLDRFRGDTLTIAATNHEQLLDPALWRRFDSAVLFPLPTEHEIEALLSRCWNQVRLSGAVNLRSTAKRLVGLSHADVERVALAAVKEMLLTGTSTLEPATVDECLSRESRRAGVARDVDSEDSRPTGTSRSHISRRQR